MKYKLEIFYEEDGDGEFTPEEFSDIKKLMLFMFEEWEGMGWINKFHLLADKRKYLIRFFIDINSYFENGNVLEIINIDDFNDTINIIFNSFNSGYMKKYSIKEVKT